MLVSTDDTWLQSVPPAVAGGYVVDTVDDGYGRCAGTHPLPQVVLTVYKWGASYYA